MDGVPPTSLSANLLRSSTTVKLSLRIPPTLDAQAAATHLKSLVETNPPYNSSVSLQISCADTGWIANSFTNHLSNSLQSASLSFFHKPFGVWGEGVTIPVMNFFKDMFKNAIVLGFGVLGPDSNAHSANECLHLAYTKNLMCSIIKFIILVTKSQKLKVD